MIKLTPHQQTGGQWGCRYSIILHSVKPKSQVKEAHVEAVFLTSLDAEIAALKAAECLIDSGIPLFKIPVQPDESAEQNFQYPADYQYDGLTINLVPDLQSNGSWRCHYLVFEPWEHSTGKRHGSAHGTFATRSEAEEAALKEAKRAIDPLGPAS